jgi:hypothetical protein
MSHEEKIYEKSRFQQHEFYLKNQERILFLMKFQF